MRPGRKKERKKKLRNMALKRNIIWGHVFWDLEKEKSLRNMV